MYNDFIVKVHRYWEEDNGSRGWDGWYFSKVYAIDGNEFLVYDDGGMSAYNGEEDFCETGFNWVDFTATMDRCGENGRQPIVEPLASFNIADYLADRKTENSSEKPNNCEDLQDWKDRMWAEAIVTEPTISKMEQVEGEPQKIGYCNECKWFRDKQVCGRCRSKNLYAPKDEPQTERSE